jgi:hypothetical protein
MHVFTDIACDEPLAVKDPAGGQDNINKKLYITDNPDLVVNINFDNFHNQREKEKRGEFLV